MARTKFPVEVLTPEGEVFSDEVGGLDAHGHRLDRHPREPRAADGDPGPDRAAAVQVGLGRGQVRTGRGLPAGGARTPRWCSWRRRSSPDELDRSDLESRLDEARKGAEEAEEGSEERARCERNVERYKAFLDVAGSGS